MPIYEYACDACRNTFEVWQSINDKPLERCPACRAARARRLISTTTFALKGSGWYVTDKINRPNKKPATEGKDS
jgi:putative FmdB family regulatory protein